MNKFNISQISPKPLKVEGILTKAIGLTLECQGINAPVGVICKIVSSENEVVDAVVTGFKDKTTFLMPLDNSCLFECGAKVFATDDEIKVGLSNSLLGRVLDGAGKPLDDKGPINYEKYVSLQSEPMNPLLRYPISNPLDVGIRAINGLITIGQGQRIGLMAGSGVGKSVLLGMMARYTKADVVVVALIGERSREVKEFIDHNLGPEGMSRSVVVTSPADYPPSQRLNGALRAMSIAEYFRDQGKQVLLLMDSLTRFSQAQREIALAMGEPPATKGYPPSAFTILPKLIERAGTSSTTNGAITALFTVLAEGDDIQDPVVDAARAILDGHIVLSRKYADKGHYPAIDIEGSVSRVMSSVTNQEHQKLALDFKKYYSLYNENKDLINIGAYVQGANQELDFAVRKINEMNRYLQQGVKENVNQESSINHLETILNPKNSDE